MYYILNETDEIIAADNNLLALCNVTDVSGLSSKVSMDDTTFSSGEGENITVITSDSEQIYPVSKTSLSSTMGQMTLVALGEVQEEKFKPLDLDEEVNFDISSDEMDSDLFEINDTVAEESTPETEELDLGEPIDLFGDTTDDLDLDVVSEDTPVDDGEIIIDISKISQMIGISEDDYKVFLNEYIDAAIDLESDLQSDDTSKRNNAVEALSNLSEVLHLPEIGQIMSAVQTTDADAQRSAIEQLYSALSRLTTETSSSETIEMELFDTVEEPEEIEEVEVVAAPNPNSFGTVDLSDVKPKHFDFQLEEAANDLSLPVELIEEFVHDFIEQAHIETKKMLEAYEEGDLAKIQAIGHLLKGASSNLRINALSDTLYKIQFCENENGLDDLIKDYWAHFLSFETQINVISN